MSAKFIILFCAQAILIKTAFSQCFNYDGYNSGFGSYGLIAPGIANGCGASALDITPTSGGNLPVTSASVLPPTGLSIASENIYEGALAAAGELPFVGTVAVQGSLPTAGAGAVNYGCGNGNTDMFAETIPVAAAFSPAGITAPIAGLAPAPTIASPFGSIAAPLAYNSPAGCRCGDWY